MPRNLVLINSVNYQGNNTYIYNLPHPVTFKGAKLSLYSFSMYNSTFNISATLGNNTFSIRWPGVANSYNFTIPDGYYAYSDLNAFIQYCCLSNKLYVVSNSQPSYFISLTQNNVRYAAQLNVLYIPSNTTAATLGYTLPSGATWAFPTTNQTPILTICSGLQSYLGMLSQSVFPLTVQTTNQSFLSTSCPIVSPVYCYLVTTNLVSSSYNNVPTLFAQIPLTASYGALLTVNNAQQQQVEIRDGVYSQIIVQFWDQSYNTLAFKDAELTLSLIIET